MKINKLFLICLFMICLLSLTAVCGQENITKTDEIINTENDLTQIESSENPIVFETNEEESGSDIDVNIVLPESEIVVNNSFSIVAHNYSGGDFEISIDGVKKNISYYGDYDEGLEIWTDSKGLDFGNHTLNVKFTNPDKSKTKTSNFTISIVGMVVDYDEKMIAGNNNWLFVTLPDDSKGYLRINIDGKKYYDEKITTAYLSSISLADLALGNHTIEVKYCKGNYPDISKKITAEVIFDVIAGNETFIYGQEGTYSFVFPWDISKNKLSVTIDNVVYKPKSIWKGLIEIDISDLTVGNHNISISYLGDNKYPQLTAKRVITIKPEIYFITIFDYGVDDSILLNLPENAKGNLTAYIDGKLYNTSSFTGGIASIPLNKIKPGEHNLIAVYTGEDYEVEMVNETLLVGIEINLPFAYYGKSYDLEIKLGENDKGNLTLTLNGKKYSSKFINGTGKIKLPNDLEIADWNLNILCECKDFTYSTNHSLRIHPVFNVPSKITNGKGSVTFNVPYSENATLYVEAFSGNEYYKFKTKIKNGSVAVPLTKLTGGKYSVYVSLERDDYYFEEYFSVNVKNDRIIAKDTSAYYTASTFKVKILSYNGKTVKSGKVTFYINGKKVKTVKTDKKGYATLKINKAPKTYTVKVKYNKVEVTKKLKIKHIVSVKSVSVKKSAKKLVLTAVVKKGKTPLKNKKITFKFNGKKYTAKTNKKGVAKVTVKKDVLKKLKGGKKVTYQATYLKDTVKKTAVVKK